VEKVEEARLMCVSFRKTADEWVGTKKEKLDSLLSLTKHLLFHFEFRKENRGKGLERN
jgi:hypothetical protein